MMDIKKNEKIAEEYIYFTHKSGLPVYIVPKKGFSKYYATFATKFGSIDNEFDIDGRHQRVPDGIAHFLEHKLFDDEKINVMEEFAKLGASDNAFTSYDKTAYLFSCTDNFYECLKILLSYVTTPYFTPQSVEKEQGIIGQEIKMYADSPEWRVTFNAIDALYKENPVKVDIAGSVESISKIDDKLLYSCYNTFYNLHNMVLCLVGDIDPDKVNAICDELLKEQKPFDIKRKEFEEPVEAQRDYSQQKLSVSTPIFCLAYKNNLKEDGRENLKTSIVTDMIVNIIAGESSELYKEMYSKAIINDSFDCGYSSGRNFGVSMFEGESKDPKKVREMVFDAINKYKKTGFKESELDRVKKLLYGAYVTRFNSLERIGNYFVSCHQSGVLPFEAIDIYESIKLEDLEKRLEEHFVESASTLSVILPKEM